MELVSWVKERGCGSMVECGLPKPETRVRFPSPAPSITRGFSHFASVLHQAGASRCLTCSRPVVFSQPCLVFPAHAHLDNFSKEKSPVLVAPTPTPGKTTYGDWCSIQREETVCDRHSRLGDDFHYRRACHHQDRLKASGSRFKQCGQRPGIQNLPVFSGCPLRRQAADFAAP